MGCVQLLSELDIILELFAWLTTNVMSGPLIWTLTRTEMKNWLQMLSCYCRIFTTLDLRRSACCHLLCASWFFLFWYQSSLRNNIFTDKSSLPKMAFVWGPVRILAPLPQRSPVESRNIWPGANSGGHRYQKSDLGDFMSAFIPSLIKKNKKKELCLMELW